LFLLDYDAPVTGRDPFQLSDPDSGFHGIERQLEAHLPDARMPVVAFGHVSPRRRRSQPGLKMMGRRAENTRTRVIPEQVPFQFQAEPSAVDAADYLEVRMRRRSRSFRVAPDSLQIPTKGRQQIVGSRSRRLVRFRDESWRRQIQTGEVLPKSVRWRFGNEQVIPRCQRRP
jgi:hypothetical protein